MTQLPPPTPSDQYASIENGPEVETKVKGSRFLGQVFRAPDAESAGLALAAIRKQYYDATHHCSAFRVGAPESAEERSDDDGEPSGTAGVPILGAIRREDLFDVFVVVTRYFGGTKLGTGGLVRAYGDSAREALAATPRRTVWRESTLEIGTTYEDVGAVEAVLAREGRHLRNVEREFLDQVRFRVTLLRSQVSSLEAILTEATAGRAAVQDSPQG
ncbi:MAG: YigZ family protein [Candidatus Eisenbacteria bacterium]